MITPTVMLVADAARRGRLMQFWPDSGPETSFFAVDLADDLDAVLRRSDFALVHLAHPVAKPALTALARLEIPALAVAAGSHQKEILRREHPQATVLSEDECAFEALAVLMAEMLKRMQACTRAERAERALSEHQSLIEVGRFMLDMRHSINNTLTSVMGNAELLLLGANSLAAGAQQQLRVIHSMSLRLYDVLQRISAIEADARRGKAAGLAPPSSRIADQLEPKLPVQSAGLQPRS